MEDSTKNTTGVLLSPVARITPAHDVVQEYRGNTDKYNENYNNLKLGAFVVDGQVYTKNVFGKYNEVLMSAQQGNTYYSYWAADTYDADAPMQLTQGQYKDIVDTMWGNDTELASSDVSKIKLEEVSEETTGVEEDTAE